MNSLSFPNALIVEPPVNVSPRKFSRGDFVTDSILVFYLYDATVYLNRHQERRNIAGNMTIIYQLAHAMTMKTASA